MSILGICTLYVNPEDSITEVLTCYMRRSVLHPLNCIFFKHVTWQISAQPNATIFSGSKFHLLKQNQMKNAHYP